MKTMFKIFFLINIFIFEHFLNTVQNADTNQDSPAITARALVDSWQQAKILHGHTDCVNSIVFSPQDQNILASGSNDGTIRLWDITQPHQLSIILKSPASAEHETDIISPQAIKHVVFSTNNPSLIIASSNDNSIYAWDIHTPEEPLCIFKINDDRVITALGFHHKNQNVLAAGSSDGIIRFCDIGNPTENPYILPLGGNWSYPMAFHPKNPHIIASACFNGSVKLWHVNHFKIPPLLHRAVRYFSRSTTLEGSRTRPSRDNDPDRSVILMFNPYNPNTLAAGFDSGKILLWNIQNPHENPLILNSDKGGVTALAFNSQKPNIIALAFNNYRISHGRGIICIYDITRPNDNPITIEGGSYVKSLAFHPQNSNLLAWSTWKKDILLQDISDWAEESCALKEYFQDRNIQKDKISQKNKERWLLIGLDHLRKQYKNDVEYQSALKKKIDQQTVKNTLSAMPENVRAAFIEKY